MFKNADIQGLGNYMSNTGKSNGTDTLSSASQNNTPPTPKEDRINKTTPPLSTGLRTIGLVSNGVGILGAIGSLFTKNPVAGRLGWAGMGLGSGLNFVGNMLDPNVEAGEAWG
jgi:hypothetical protein